MTRMTKVRFYVFAFLSLAVALISWRFLVTGVEATMSFMTYHLQARPIWLYGHIFFAPLALAVMPFQFHTKLRNKHRVLHRWIGRIYGIAILIAGVSGLVLAWRTQAGPVAAWGFGALAVFWLAATGRAIWLARERRIPEHKIWMIRSAALTFAAVTLRLYLPILEVTLGFETAYLIVSWLAWVPNVIAAELWLVPRRENKSIA